MSPIDDTETEGKKEEKVVRPHELTKWELDVATKVFRSFETGLREGTILPKVIYRIKKSQNCGKAAIAFVCTTCKRQLLFALLQLIFCKHFCN